MYYRTQDIDVYQINTVDENASLATGLGLSTLGSLTQQIQKCGGGG